MNSSWKIGGALAAMLLLDSSPLRAAETWSCEFDAYRHKTTKEQASFRVEAGRLVENSGDAIVDYQLLEDSKTAIVAAKGGGYASEPWVMGFLVMIRKDTGSFLLVTASLGDTNDQQPGTCRLIAEHGPN